MSPSTRRRFALISFAALVAVPACGNDEDPVAAPSDTAATSGPPASAPSGSTNLFSDDLAAVDADRTGETLKIGLVNTESAAISVPEFRIGGEVAADAINQDGGINGATVEVVTCLTDGSPESSIDCANELISEGVDVAAYGYDAGGASAVPLYSEAGIPYIFPTGYADNIKNDPNSHGFGAPVEAYAATISAFFAEQGVEHMGYLALDAGESAYDFEATLEKYAEAAGLDYDSILVNPAAPDYGAAIASLVASGADGLWAFLDEASCTQFITAARQADFSGPLSPGTCTTYISDVPGEAAGTYTMAERYTPGIASLAPERIAGNLEQYEQAMTEAGEEDLLDSQALATYSMFMDLRTMLERVPADTELDAAGISEAITASGVVPSFSGPDLNCGSGTWPGNPGACREALLLLEVSDDGTRSPVSDENFGFRSDVELATS